MSNPSQNQRINQRISEPASPKLVDPFHRPISYLRISVTDRCDFRCVYCMAETMTFLPKKDLLTLEELDRLCSAFIGLGVNKLRLTGGEPLVRKNILQLFKNLSRHLETGQLSEMTVTTNGSQLSKMAADLYATGVRRINVSLDTLDAEKFQTITRWGRLDQVLDGISAAKKAGLKIKINTVALKGLNETEIPSIMQWAHGQGHDHTLIETMPLGEIDGDRTDQYLPLTEVRKNLESTFTLNANKTKTGGPARYFDVRETGGQLGLITPMTHNFCEGCNRVRVTCTGQLYMCLGQDDQADLRHPLRQSDGNEALEQAIRAAIARKPKGHDFIIDRAQKTPTISRHMSLTGG